MIRAEMLFYFKKCLFPACHLVEKKSVKDSLV